MMRQRLAFSLRTTTLSPHATQAVGGSGVLPAHRLAKTTTIATVSAAQNKQGHLLLGRRFAASTSTAGTVRSLHPHAPPGGQQHLRVRLGAGVEQEHGRPRVAVVLSGCGVFDGSGIGRPSLVWCVSARLIRGGTEVQEATSVLVHLSRHGADYACFAPNTSFTVYNHATGASLKI